MWKALIRSFFIKNYTEEELSTVPNMCSIINVRLALFNSRCYSTNSLFPPVSHAEVTSIQGNLISNKCYSNPPIGLLGLYLKSIFAAVDIMDYERTKFQG